MRRAIELAFKGAGWVNPNPMVGAVIVKEGKVLAEGYHHKYGELHAERDAISKLNESADGATIFVTLEPCCHHGKQPPCTEAIVDSGIKKVVIGSRDPNPLVAGKGVSYLREHGVEVEEDFLREECDALNPVFFHYITHKTPYIVLKYAMTLDGKIATRTGDSKWITGDEARAHVQALRGRYSAILAGIVTVLSDDPMLNCRAEGAHQPLRIILDSHLRIPEECRLVKSAAEFPLMVAFGEETPELINKRERLEKQNVKCRSFPGEDGKVNIRALLKYLGEEKIDSVLVEGGGEINEAFIKAGAINYLYVYMGNMILGGRDAKTPVEGEGAELMQDGAYFNRKKITTFGKDILFEYEYTGGEACLPE
ncbi:MAG: bifunctional diaminohydroxyphosphoribosylaminopyrimidine deaminase/5-amino-6-(5-phosphoribosylamino)uracil reductase RibD [Lachnospiraceae bacterium]|nr:bifunctional diaminohydroxyphosphoribosylaminopyrimidine deaminase/5-amino-6-(5-phosphoribosylamino)uracil reductase RibD [Lachnospiraceae bacterium]